VKGGFGSTYLVHGYDHTEDTDRETGYETTDDEHCDVDGSGLKGASCEANHIISGVRGVERGLMGLTDYGDTSTELDGPLPTEPIGSSSSE